MKKQLRRLTLISLAFIAPQLVWAQETPEHFSCGLPKHLTELYQAYPELEAGQQELIERSRHSQLNASGDREDVYTIPVVFHILHLNGSENISDDQVYDQMDILNTDYRLLNSDTADIVTDFKALATDAHIEFKLATVDQYGNCTNGIEHIYTHETNNGDDYSKLNQWSRSRYLNIWVVNSMENGVAGYAYYPSAVVSGLAYADGIIILNDYIGSIGTGSAYRSRALTHEIGHYLGLPHTWGSTNDPEVACGDDGITDTPVTAGHSSCVLTNTDNCNAGIEENVQNYMEYSYCSNMFTADQVSVMRTSLESTESSRDNLVLSTNHTSTGINETVLCTPLPDFYASSQVACTGETVQFYASTQRAAVDSYSWHFTGGTPEYSTDASPSVTFDSEGVFEVELTVTNSAGSETKTVSDFMHVRSTDTYLNPSFTETFNNNDFTEWDWAPINLEEDAQKFQLVTTAGYNDSRCIGVIHYKEDPDEYLYPNYYNRLGGTVNSVVSPHFRTNRIASGGSLTFKYAYATISSGEFDPSQLQLKVYYKSDCETNWHSLTTITGDNLITGGYVGDSFMPTEASQWGTKAVNLPNGAYGDNVCFKFEYTAEDNSNNFFIDNINITGVLADGSQTTEVYDMVLYPNPINNGQILNLNMYSVKDETIEITIVDVLGKEISTQNIQVIQGMNTVQVDYQNQLLAKGLYKVMIKSESAVNTLTLVVN